MNKYSKKKIYTGWKAFVSREQKSPRPAGAGGGLPRRRRD